MNELAAFLSDLTKTHSQLDKNTCIPWDIYEVTLSNTLEESLNEQSVHIIIDVVFLLWQFFLSQSAIQTEDADIPIAQISSTMNYSRLLLIKVLHHRSKIKLDTAILGNFLALHWLLQCSFELDIIFKNILSLQHHEQIFLIRSNQAEVLKLSSTAPEDSVIPERLKKEYTVQFSPLAIILQSDEYSNIIKDLFHQENTIKDILTSAYIKLAKTWDSIEKSAEVDKYMGMVIINSFNNTPWIKFEDNITNTALMGIIPITVRLIEHYDPSHQLLGFYILIKTFQYTSAGPDIIAIVEWIIDKVLFSIRAVSDDIVRVAASRLMTILLSMSQVSTVLIQYTHQYYTTTIKDLSKEYGIDRLWYALIPHQNMLRSSPSVVIICHLQELIGLYLHILNRFHLPMQRIVIQSIILILEEKKLWKEFEGVVWIIISEMLKLQVFYTRRVISDLSMSVTETDYSRADSLTKDIQRLFEIFSQHYKPQLNTFRTEIEKIAKSNDSSFLLSCLNELFVQVN